MSFAEGDNEGLPTLTVTASELEQQSLIDAFIQIGFASSKGEVRRLIRGGGARLNNQPITEEERMLQTTDFDKDGKAQIAEAKNAALLSSCLTDTGTVSLQPGH